MKQERSKWSHRLTLGLVGLMLATTLVACGSDSTPVAQNNPTTTVATTTTSAGTTTANTPGIVSLPTVTPGVQPATTDVATTSGATTDNATTAASTTASADTTAVATTAANVPDVARANRVAFATYKLPAVNTKAAFPKYSVSANLSNVTNLGDFSLTEAQKKLLAQNYFVASPSDYKQFYQAYESFRYDQIPTYISTDSVAHVYHLLFDKLLRETEKGYLIKDAQTLAQSLYKASQQQYDALSGTDWQPAALRNVAFFAVAAKLAAPQAKLDVPAYASQMVDDQLKLIADGGGRAPSPVMGSDYEEDYSQYTPRGHYTKTEDLKNYFRVMMWYGRLTFRASNDSETESAVLLTQALLNAPAGSGQSKAGDIWKLIYEPTSFFVGNSDDLTYQDYANVIKAVYGQAGLSDPKVVASDPGKFAAFKQGVDKLPPAQINSMITYTDRDLQSQIKGLRLMGQRFTLDAYIFQNLIWRNVGTDSKPRLLPSGLDVFGVLGSDQAVKLLKTQGATDYANYQTRFDKVKGEVSKLPTSQWTSNLYWSWLYTLQSLTPTRGAGYPVYMQNEAWQRKQLVTDLASWTELKHDTLLYSKQVYAERGGGPVELPVGFVEPEPTFYARMAALAAMTRQGLQQRNLIDKQYADILQQLETDALRLKTISEKELAGQKVSDDDRDFIAYWGATIETFTLAAADPDAQNPDGTKYLDKQDAAVVADVATGIDNVLEEGTGRINLIYVAVPVNGKVILTQGAVYSQYEFTVPVSNRLTDEAWQNQLNSGKAPALEDWKKSYLAPGVPKPTAQP